MSTEASISQRDLRLRSREIMDAVEKGDSFAVTRDGRVIGSLQPRTTQRTFVAARELIEVFRHVPVIDAEAMREQLDLIVDPSMVDPYAR
jgi:hypothetical protein